MFNDPLYRFQTYLSREYDIGFHDPTFLTPYLNVEDVWADYSGQGVVIAAYGPVDHLHPELSAHYDTNYLASYNAWTSGDLDSGVVVPTFWLGLAAADADNATGIVGVAHNATIRGEFRAAPDIPADIMLSGVFGDPYEVGGGVVHFDASARGGKGNIVLLNSPDTWQSSGDYTSGTLHSEFAMNTDRHNITMSGLTAYGYEPHGLGNTHGPMTLVSVPIFTSSYLTPPVGPIPGPNEDTEWTGGFDPLASSDTTTTLGLDLSGDAGESDSDTSIGDGWEFVANAWFPELIAQVDSADYTYDASTNGAIGVGGGVIALMLEANPDLGWRDVQEILAFSANPLLARPMPLEPANAGNFASVYFDDVQNGAKTWNGGGLWHSAETGFGALDAHAAVRLAETWEGQHTSDNEVSTAATADDLPTAEFPMGRWTELGAAFGNDPYPQYGDGIHKNAPTILDFAIDVDEAIDIEHVSLSVDLTAIAYSTPIGVEPGAQFIFSIISPDGTESVLSSSVRPFYWDGAADFEDVDWEFTTRAFWGETTTDGDGEWTARVRYSGITDERIDVTIDDLTLNFYGKPADEDDTYIFTDAAGFLGVDWSKNDGADSWIIRPDAPVLSDADGHNVINAAAAQWDLNLTAQAGETAMAAHNPDPAFDFDGETEYALYTLGTGTVIHDLIAGDGNDVLKGSVGDNTLSGMRGADTLTGGAGNDTLYGGASADELQGSAGADAVHGEAGADLIRGGTGQDMLTGGSGNDTLRGQRDADLLEAGAGDDNVKGGGGNDTLFGEDGNDFLKGGTRKDNIFGGKGNDRLIGNAFDDSLNGGGGDDTLNAGGDNDTLIGGTGQDVMKGGGGEDTFVFSANYDADTITDFNISEDILQLSVALTGTRNVQAVVDRADVQDTGVVLDFDSTVITLEGLNSTVGLDEAILIV